MTAGVPTLVLAVLAVVRMKGSWRHETLRFILKEAALLVADCLWKDLRGVCCWQTFGVGPFKQSTQSLTVSSDLCDFLGQAITVCKIEFI